MTGTLPAYVKPVMNYRLLSCIDLPAGRKIRGFMGHSARLGCLRCFKEFPGSIGTMDYSGFDRHNWKPHTKLEHNSAAFKIKQLNTKSAIDKAESESGCHYSELLLLPYFDAPKMLIIDPMHNLFLGSAKYFMKNILITKGLLSDANLCKIQDKTCQMPFMKQIAKFSSRQYFPLYGTRTPDGTRC